MTHLDPELLAHSAPITELFGNPLPTGTLWVTHPLLDDLPPVRPGQEEQVNKALAKARIRLGEIEKRGAWEEAIFAHEPGSRLNAFVRYAAKLTDEEYWRLASEVWTSYTFTSFVQLQIWTSVLGSSRANRSAMMNKQERDALEWLPALVRIFRGFDYLNGQFGWSWTLSKEVARRFAHDGIDGGTKLVAEGQVERDSIIALLLRNGEEEVVVNVDHVSTGRIFPA